MKRNTFETIYGLGYETVIPIMPHDAKLSDQSKVKQEDRGKVPGRLNGANYWTGFPKWQDHEATPKDLKQWSEWGAGVGIQCGSVVAFDIDVMDAELSAAIGKHIWQKIGPGPVRVGRPPKQLILYRTADILFKRKLKFTLADGTEHAVEFLGKGQQFVAHGIHPGTLQPYTWWRDKKTRGSLPPFINLTEITAAMVDDIWQSLHGLVTELGGILTEEHTTSTREDRKAIGDPSRMGDPQLIIQALQHLPNNLDYDRWISMCAAIKAAFGGDETYYEHFEEWCLKYEGNTSPDIRRRWDSINSSELGANYVLDMARAAGFNDAAEIFTADEDAEMFERPDQGRQQAIDAMFERYIWVEETQRFYDTQTHKMLDSKQLNVRLVAVGNPASPRTCASMVFLRNEARRRTVWGLTYRPGKELLVDEDYGTSVNTWRPADMRLPEMVTDKDVKPWLDLVAHVIPDEEARDIVLDWAAYALTHPSQKCNWAVLLGSTTQGIGKDMMFKPLVDSLGVHNTKYIGPSDLAGGYTDWAANAKLIVVEEMHAFERKEMMNKLKAYIAAPPEHVRVNIKYIPQYQVPNVGAYLFFTNLTNALAIEKEDRRFYIYWSPAKRDETGMYARVMQWYAAGGTAKVARWLMQRDLMFFDAQGAAPGSIYKEEMRRASQGAFEDWVETCIDERQAPFDTNLIIIEDILRRMPPRIERAAGANRQKLAHVIKQYGGETLKRVRLGKGLDTTGNDRAYVTAIRNTDFYMRMDGDQLRDQFWKEREEAAKNTADPEDD